MAELLWRFMNYLCVSMLYLRDNVNFSNSLRMDDFKTSIVGHWGTCPGVNAIYAHLIDYRIKWKPDWSIKLVLSTGHSATSLLAAAFLDGTLFKYYPEYERNIEGLNRICKAYGDAFSSEIDAFYPGNIYCGGELGSGLAFSQGYVFNHPERLVACIIGDGELETPACQASFQGFRFIDSNRDGRVLPIINLNGFKMGCRSIISFRTDEEIIGYFNYYGLKTIFASEDHESISNAMKDCFALLKNGKFPILVLKSIKGWSAPMAMGGRLFAGSANAHKPILKNPKIDATEFQEIKDWLESYHCEDFFEGEYIKPKIIEYVDKIEESIIDFDRNQAIIRKYKTVAGEYNNDPAACCDVMKEDSDIIVFSPDELASNGFDSIRSSCRVFELLSEQTCFGWCAGYSAGGGSSVLITYEAFAPLVDSLIDQYLKSISVLDHTGYSLPAITIVVTSLGWQNVPSHHNPSFADRLIGYGEPHVKLYFPLSPKNAANILNKCLADTNCLNILVMDKRPLSNLYASVMVENDGVWILRNTEHEGNCICFVTVGDIVTEEVLEAYDLLGETDKDRIKVLGLETFDAIDVVLQCGYSSLNVWVYNGRPSVVESLLWERGLSNEKNIVMGFSGKATMPSGSGRLKESNVDAKTIVCLMKSLIAFHKVKEK